MGKKDDAYKKMVKQLQGDIDELCDSIKAAMKDKKPLKSKANRNFRQTQDPDDEDPFRDKSGSMEPPPMTLEQTIALTALLVEAAQKAGVKVRFKSAKEMGFTDEEPVDLPKFDFTSLNRGTDIAAGMEAAMKLMSGTSGTGSQQLFVYTDGDIKDDGPDAVARLLKSSNLKLTDIGIGLHGDSTAKRKNPGPGSKR